MFPSSCCRGQRGTWQFWASLSFESPSCYLANSSKGSLSTSSRCSTLRGIAIAGYFWGCGVFLAWKCGSTRTESLRSADLPLRKYAEALSFVHPRLHLTRPDSFLRLPCSSPSSAHRSHHTCASTHSQWIAGSIAPVRGQSSLSPSLPARSRKIASQNSCRHHQTTD